MAAPNDNINMNVRSQINPEKRLPSVGIRSAAWFTDLVLVVILAWALGLTKLNIKFPLFNYVFPLISYLIVVIGPLWLSNRTLGKKIFKLKIKMNDGSLMGIPTIFMREFIFKYLVFFMVPFALGGFINGLTKNSFIGFAVVIGVYALFERLAKKNQGFFWDKICKTQVEYE